MDNTTPPFVSPITRRQFHLAALGTFAAISSAMVSLPAAAASRRGPSRLALVKPPALKRGDLVGLIAPSGATNDTFVQQRVKNLEAFGMRVKVSRHILATRGNTAGSAQQRVDDLHAMFLDKEITAIWAVRGGSGASQMLPLIDYPLIRRHPKIFVGYSDITALHLAILRHAGLITFHGPVASAAFTDYAATQLEAVLMHPRRETTIYMSAANQAQAPTAAEFRMRTLAAGVAEGRLIGGNLSVLAALVGTPFAADWKDALLFLEDIREAPYRIDRMLTQLNQSQPLKEAAGVMLGVFRRSDTPADEPALTLEQTLEDHFSAFAARAKPAVYGYSFGHIANQFTIPLGVRARLDTRAETLTLLEPAVLI